MLASSHQALPGSNPLKSVNKKTVLVDGSAEREGFAFCCAKLTLRCAWSSMLASSHQALPGSNPLKSVNKKTVLVDGSAEREGFEPTMRFPHTCFQDRRLKPLGHLSQYANDFIMILKTQQEKVSHDVNHN